MTEMGSERPFQQPKLAGDKTDDRVVVNEGQVRRVAGLIAGLEEVTAYDYVDPSLPPLNHPLTVDYLFATVLQQFSFWTVKEGRYHRPLIATIGGEKLKGAFYLWKAYTRRIDTDPSFFSPEGQASQRLEDTLALFRSDDGEDVMPAVEMHLEAANRYGKTMLALGWTPKSVLETASASDRPLETLLGALDQVGGYREDPLRKKSALLAQILHDRPEGFFEFGANETLPPVMDYHLMRSCLRMGMVDVVDGDLRRWLEERRLVSAQDEWAVRYASYRAVEMLPELSGRPMAAVGDYLFLSRRRCPEMTEPDCASCSADLVCAHRKELFQPVIRTDYY